jgi:hypothetical protein
MIDLKELDALAELNGVDADVVRPGVSFDSQSRVTELDLVGREESNARN